VLSHYKQPTHDVLDSDFHTKLSSATRLRVCSDIFYPLLKVNDELYIAALLWYKQSTDVDPATRALIEELLGITKLNEESKAVAIVNPMDPRQELIYLQKLIIYINELKFQTDPKTGCNLFKEQILLAIARCVDHVDFIGNPMHKLEALRQIPRKRLEAKAHEGSLKRLGSYFRDRTEERRNEIILIETIYTLFMDSLRAEEPVFIEALISAMAYFFMHRFETDTYTKLPGTDFYAPFAQLLGTGHSTQIDPVTKNIFCNLLNDYFSSINEKQWRKACRSKENFDRVNTYFIIPRAEQIEAIRTTNNIPCDVKDAASAVAKDTGLVALDVVKKVGVVAVAGKLYCAGGIGSRIVGSAAQSIGGYLASYTGTIGEYFLKTPLIVATETAGETVAVYGLKRGLDRAFTSVIGDTLTEEPQKVVPADIRLDPFEILLKLGLMYSRSAIDRECMQAIQRIYAVFPERIRSAFNADMNKWYKNPAKRVALNKEAVGAARSEAKVEAAPAEAKSPITYETQALFSGVPLAPPPPYETPESEVMPQASAPSPHRALNLYPPQAVARSLPTAPSSQAQDEDWVNVKSPAKA